MLKIEEIDVFYGKVQSLFQLSLSIEEGKIVALIGANGAGKSTTLKTISGLLHPSSGTIEFLGRQVHKMPSQELVALGIIQCPEERRLWPDMTVQENLILGAFSRKDKEEINEDLNDVYSTFPVLEERKKQRAGNLSGGEQQMLAIARALMGKPKLIMFDEPSLGLAPILVEQTAGVIQDINKRGTTVLLVEQNAYLAINMADYAYVLETGRVVLEGSGDELLENELVKKAYLGR